MPIMRKMNLINVNFWTYFGPRYNWICFSVAPSSTPPLHLVNSQLVCLPPVGIFNNLCSICSICLCIYSIPNYHRGAKYIDT